ncbi:hypothetical protein JB92DRAFT_3046630 [Gautieria morchelliformis]|nr:hypothetical protein JB92DRAFT_3046630 [Gautieria morchelliformis]
MPPNTQHTYDATLGAALIGLTLTSILYGLTSLQTFFYYTRYYKDNAILKILVSWTWILDTVHTAIVGHILYYYLVTNYNNPPALNLIVWSLALEVGITTFATVAVQSFFIWRVWILSRRSWLITGPIIILAFIAFVSGLACMAEAFMLGTIQNLIKIEWVVGVKHGSIAAADIGIAATQCWYLHFSRTGTKRTDNMINTLMIYTINRGILNSIAAVADLACFLAMPDNFVWLAFNLIMAKLYSNSLLATLNTRNALLGRGADTDLEVTKGTLHISGSRRNRHTNALSDWEVGKPSTQGVQLDLVLDTTQQMTKEESGSHVSFAARVEGC